MTAPGRLERARWELSAPEAGEVLVKIAGCGVCHTDVGFFSGETPTRHGAPIVLGHEISGTVIEAGKGAESWRGRSVVVPAVAPCGSCDSCKAGRPTACRHGIMPGNDRDGGFATHVVVSSRGLCATSDLGRIGLEDLSVVADAVTTPLQAIRRARLGSGDLAVFVGVGGIGGFGVQIAAAMDAIPIAIDVDERRLARAAGHGARATIDGRMPPKELKAAVRGAASDLDAPADGWRIFEMSGTPAGQEAAFGLLTLGGSLSIVGFTPEPVKVRLSNVMALDAKVIGNWGADPALYPEAVSLCTSGAISLDGFVKRFPLDEAPQVLEAARRGEILERPVLCPGASA